MNFTNGAFAPVFDSHLMDICENLKRATGSDSYSVGVPAHDEHHEKIVEKYNDFIQCLRNPDALDERPERFQALVSFVGLHFAFENSLMQVIGYPDYEQHKKQHSDFIDRVNLFAADIQASLATIEELILYIGHWLLGHVLIADKQFGEFEAGLAVEPVH